MKKLTYKYIVENLPVVENEKKLLWLGFYITLYFENGHTREKREAVLELFREYWSLCGEQLQWTTHPETHIWEKLTPQYLPIKWLLQQTEEKHVWNFHYHGGSTLDECSPFRIYGLGVPLSTHSLSYLSASFPVTWFAEHQNEDAPSLVKRWCSILKPLHGSAGIAILTPLDTKQESRMAPYVRSLSQRFPGLEVDYPTSHILYLQKGIKGVNWLTIFEERWLEKLGGIDLLRKRLGNEIVIYEYPQGVLIQATSHPQIGDLNRKMTIESYCKVSAVLKPIRIEYPTSLLGFDFESTQEWFHRFD